MVSLQLLERNVSVGGGNVVMAGAPGTIDDAKRLWDQRGYQEPGLSNAKQCESIAKWLLDNNPPQDQLFEILTLLAASNNFLGMVVDDTAAKLDYFTFASSYGEKILSQLFHVTVTSSTDTDALARRLKGSLNQSQLQQVAMSSLLSGASWLGWAGAKADMNGFFKLQTVHAYVNFVNALGFASIYYYTCPALNGIIDCQLPAQFGGNKNRALATFQPLVQLTQATNLSCSINGMISYYYINTLFDLGQTDNSRKVANDYLSNNDFYPRDLVPENLYYRNQIELSLRAPARSLFAGLPSGKS